MRKCKRFVASIESINTLPIGFFKECFEYHRDTGDFYWRNRPLEHFDGDERAQKITNTQRAGERAGTTNPGGYKYTTLNRGDKRYFILFHHLVWVLEGNVLEEGKEIDHRDNNPSNNHISNLRMATVQQNRQNNKRKKLPASGIRGVHFDARHCSRNLPWYAIISINGRAVNLGNFKTKEEAADARKRATTEHYKEFAPAEPTDPVTGFTADEEEWLNSIGSL